MPLLTRDQVKEIVFQALEQIANLPADPEDAPLDQLQPEHINIFLTALAEIIENTRAYPNDPADTSHYDVVINIDVFNEWKTVKDCIDYIFENQVIV